MHRLCESLPALGELSLSRQEGPTDQSATCLPKPAQSRRELQKSRNDVFQWLEAHNHMVAVSKAAPDAQKLKVKADRVKGLHLELSALKLAVKAAISQVEKEHQELVERKEQRTEEVTAQAEGFPTLPH